MPAQKEKWASISMNFWKKNLRIRELMVIDTSAL